MPLKLDLKTGEKMVVNGAVLENVGPSAKILVHNMASILREKAQQMLATKSRNSSISMIFIRHCGHPEN